MGLNELLFITIRVIKLRVAFFMPLGQVFVTVAFNIPQLCP